MFKYAKNRKCSSGANLAFFAVVSVAVIGLAAVGIYTGVQAYFQSEIQKTASTAAMAGAAAYYTHQSAASGQPQADPAFAASEAQKVFNDVKNASPAMQSYNVSLSGAPSAADDVVTVRVSGTFPTPIMAIVGIDTVKVDGDARALAIKHVPTNITGPISLAPVASSAQNIRLNFPVVDGPAGNGTEIYVRQSVKRGYSIEACNSSACYDITATAKLAGSSKRTPNGKVIYGSCYINLQDANVPKATHIRFADDGVYDVYYGSRHFLDTQKFPAIIDRVEIYGYASACPMIGPCPVPAGFERV